MVVSLTTLLLFDSQGNNPEVCSLSPAMDQYARSRDFGPDMTLHVTVGKKWYSKLQCIIWILELTALIQMSVLSLEYS